MVLCHTRFKFVSIVVAVEKFGNDNFHSERSACGGSKTQVTGHRSGQVYGFLPCAQRVNQVKTRLMSTPIIYLICISR